MSRHSTVFFLLFTSDHEYLYCRMNTQRLLLYSFFISCLQFRCLICNALNFNAFLHRHIQNIYIKFEPGSYSLQFISKWMIYPVNKLLGCVCSCAQFFSPLLKLLSYSVQEILTSAEERGRFHVKNWQEIEAPWSWKKHLMNSSL